MLKFGLALLLSAAVYYALGTTVTQSDHAAVIITILGGWGTFTYKGLLAMATFGLLHRNLG